MTDRSVSWTDTERLAKLLTRVSAPRQTPLGTAVSPMGVVTSASPSRARAIPAPAPVQTWVKPRPSEPAVVPRLEQTSDNPSDRLDALVAWTLDNYRCTGAFVADDNGLTLAAHGISEAHVSLVGPLLSALVGIRAIPGIDATAGALWLGANMMSWVEAHTERGGFCLGAVGKEPLSTRAFDQLKEALELTVRGL
jgi:hypothetical protein